MPVKHSISSFITSVMGCSLPTLGRGRGSVTSMVSDLRAAARSAARMRACASSMRSVSHWRTSLI